MGGNTFVEIISRISIQIMELEKKLGIVQQAIKNQNEFKEQAIINLKNKSISLMESEVIYKKAFETINLKTFEEADLKKAIESNKCYKKRIQLLMTFSINKISVEDASLLYFELIKEEAILGLQKEITNARFQRAKANSSDEKEKNASGSILNNMNKGTNEVNENIKKIRNVKYENSRFNIQYFSEIYGISSLSSINAEWVLDKIEELNLGIVEERLSK